VFNVTIYNISDMWWRFLNISVMAWWSILLVVET